MSSQRHILSSRKDLKIWNKLNNYLFNFRPQCNKPRNQKKTNIKKLTNGLRLKTHFNSCFEFLKSILWEFHMCIQYYMIVPTHSFPPQALLALPIHILRLSIFSFFLVVENNQVNLISNSHICMSVRSFTGVCATF